MTLLTIFADTTSTHSCTDTNCWTMSMMERMHHTIWVWHERKDNFDHWKHFHLICASNHKARREGDKKFDDIKTFSSQTENSMMNIGQILFMLTVGINIKNVKEEPKILVFQLNRGKNWAITFIHCSCLLQASFEACLQFFTSQTDPNANTI